MPAQALVHFGGNAYRVRWKFPHFPQFLWVGAQGTIGARAVLLIFVDSFANDLVAHIRQHLRVDLGWANQPLFEVLDAAIPFQRSARGCVVCASDWPMVETSALQQRL